MGEQRVVIVGGGQAGVQVADSLRSAGATGPITIVADEAPVPYQRPPLSKDYMAKGGDPAPLPLRGGDFFAERDIALDTGRAVVAIDREAREVDLADGSRIPYDALVLATGARNRDLKVPGSDLDGVLGLRTLEDAERLRSVVETARRVVVVGAGFIGLEFAAAARSHDIEVTVLEFAERPMGRALTPAMSDWFATAHGNIGVNLRLGEAIATIEGAEGHVTHVTSTRGHTYPADVVVMGVGVVPATELALQAGLEVDNGIAVDAHLQTSDPHIWAVGDCVSFPSGHAGARVRLESVQNATDQARHVAQMILGEERSPYGAVPWFWSNQGPYRLQIVGLVGPGMTSVVRGDPDANKFSVFVFDGDKLAAVESVNSPADHMAARRLLESGRGLTPQQAGDPAFDLKAYSRGA